MARVFILLFFSSYLTLTAQPVSLPVWKEELNTLTSDDWLIKSFDGRANVYITQDKKNLVLHNGLVKRVFRIQPNVACIDFTNLTTGQQLLRAIAPEARVTINSRTYHVGGLKGQKEKAYKRTKRKSVSIATMGR